MNTLESLLLGFGILVGFCILSILDIKCYVHAKYPDRRRWWAFLPGGGIAALLVFGRNE